MQQLSIDNLVFELTEACNQRCRFCYNHWRGDDGPIAPPAPSLTRKTLRKLLSQANVGSISFSGGEPLLLPTIHDLALMARFKGSRVNILTNGTLLDDDALLNFRSIGIGAIQIPLLSADPAVHDYLTQVPGSWEKAKRALRMAGDAGIGVAVVVITGPNAPGIPETLSLIKDCGIGTVMVNRFNIGGNGIRNCRELLLSRTGMQDAFAMVESFARSHPEMKFVSGVCTPLCFMDTAPYPHVRFSKCSTELTGRPLTVNYKGEVRFCNHSPKVMGNIHERRIGEILDDPEMNSYYSQLPGACAECPLLKRCGGGCRAAAEQVYGTFSAMDPILDLGGND